MNTVHTEQYRDCTIKIAYDDDCASPRDNENLGTMICWHRRGQYGDIKTPCEPSDFDPSDYEVCLPIYAYEHGGIALSVSRSGQFADMWDSGQLGFIYARRETILKNYDSKRITKTIRENVVNILASEVDAYSRWLGGACYGYIVNDADGDTLDSCWGFICDYDGYVLEEAKLSVDDYADSIQRKADALHDELRSNN